MPYRILIDCIGLAVTLCLVIVFKVLNRNFVNAISKIRKKFSEAIDRGFTTLDTASTYGFGLCDEVIGNAIKGKRDRVQIVAKYGQRWNSSEGTFICDSEDPQGNPMKIMRNSRPESIIEECEEILKRLKTDYIDLFVCHWPDTATPQAESMGAVSKLIEQGKVLAAGVSNFSLEQMKEAHTAFPIA